MGKVITRKIQGMSWWLKASLVLILTLVTSVFIYEGWYKPLPAQAATQTYYMQSDTTSNIGVDGTCNLPAGTPAATQAAPLYTTLATAESTIAARYYAPIITNGTVLKMYGPVYTANAVDISAISASFAVRPAANADTIRLYLYDYDPAGTAGNKTLVATSTVLTEGTAGTTYTKTWAAANFTINGTGRVAKGHRLLVEVVLNTTVAQSRIYCGVSGLTTSSNITVTETAVIVNPTVTAASPSLNQGATSQTVTINGTGFQSGATVTFSGTGVTAGASTYVSATQITVPVTVTSSATPGARNVTVTNSDTGSGTGTGVFTVTATQPTVISLSPSSLRQGDPQTTVTITGTNFLSGSTVAFSGSGITLGSATYVNATTITVPVTVSASATLGSCNVTVTLPDAQTAGTGTGIFTVTAPCAAGTPTSLTVGTETSSSIPLTWTGGGTTDYFSIYRNGTKISTDGAITTGSFTDSGLTAGAAYTYTVSGYNSTGACESAQTSVASGYVLPVTPSAPTVANPGTGTTLNVTIGSDANDSTVQFAIRVNGGSYTNQYVQSGGAVGASQAWQTKSAWSTVIVSGLTASTAYTFDVYARNTNGTPDVVGPGASKSATTKITYPSTITTCSGCHSYPPVDATDRNSTTPGQFQGSHTRHAGTGSRQYGVACTSCHTSNTTFTHSNGTIDMSLSTGSYSQGSHAVSNSTTFGTCSNTYCHSNGTSVATSSIPANTSPTWASTGPLACTTCHGTPPSYKSGTPKMNSHTSARGHKFVIGTTTALTCDICHKSVTYSGGTYTPNVTYHVSGTYNLQDTYGYTFSTTGGTCSTPGNGCHGPTAGTWGGKLKCIDCHSKVITRTKGRPGTTLAAVTTEFGLAWGHKKTGRAAVSDDDCCVCHLEGDGVNHRTTSYHQNGNIDLRDPTATSAETAITDMSGTAWTFQRFSTSYAAGSRTTAAINTQNTIDNIITQKFCLGCHKSTGAINPGARSGTSPTQYLPFGTGSQNGATYTVGLSAGVIGGVVDVDSQLATTNASAHPVKGPRSRAYPANTAGRLYSPYDNFTRTAGTKSNSVVINCFDCHNVVGTPLTLRTVAAHGNAVTIRGNTHTVNASPYTQTLCNVCHQNYIQTATTNHTTGSAFATGGSSSMGSRIPSDCQYCHSSGSGQSTGVVNRPVKGEDVHGFDRFAGTGTDAMWPVGATETFKPFAFMRNTKNWSASLWKPLNGTGVTTGTATCTSANLSETGCTGNSMGTYTPGGAY